MGATQACPDPLSHQTLPINNTQPPMRSTPCFPPKPWCLLLQSVLLHSTFAIAVAGLLIADMLRNKTDGKSKHHGLGRKHDVGGY